MDSVPNARPVDSRLTALLAEITDPAERRRLAFDWLNAEHPEAIRALVTIELAAFHTVFDPLHPSIVGRILKDATAYDRVHGLVLRAAFSRGPERAAIIDELTPIMVDIVHAWHARGWLADDDPAASIAPSAEKRRRARAAHARRRAAERRNEAESRGTEG